MLLLMAEIMFEWIDLSFLQTLQDKEAFWARLMKDRVA